MKTCPCSHVFLLPLLVLLDIFIAFGGCCDSSTTLSIAKDRRGRKYHNTLFVVLGSVSLFLLAELDLALGREWAPRRSSCIRWSDTNGTLLWLFLDLLQASVSRQSVQAAHLNVALLWLWISVFVHDRSSVLSNFIRLILYKIYVFVNKFVVVRMIW